MNNMNKLSTEQWKELLAAASVIKDLKPWERLWDNDLITIQLPDEPEPVFCSVMGRIEECFAVAFYFGYQQLRTFYNLEEAEESEPNFITMFSQECLICYFGDREELEGWERDIIRDAGFKFRGRGQWPFFKSMKPGKMPWFINAEEAARLIEAMRGLVAAYLDWVENKLSVDFENGETLFRYYDDARKIWINEKRELPPCPVVVEEHIITDELFCARLKSKKKTKTVVELDIFHIPVPVWDDDEDVPMLPRFCILVDGVTGMVFEQKLLESGEDNALVMIEALRGYIMEKGRPASIIVRDKTKAAAISDLCKKIDVRLVCDMGCPTIDMFLNSCGEFI